MSSPRLLTNLTCTHYAHVSHITLDNGCRFPRRVLADRDLARKSPHLRFCRRFDRSDQKPLLAEVKHIDRAAHPINPRIQLREVLRSDN